MTNSVDRLSNLQVLAFENLCSCLGLKDAVRLSTVSKGLMEKIYTNPQLIPCLRLGERERFVLLRAERAQLLSKVLELRGPNGFDGTVDQAWKKKDALNQSFEEAKKDFKERLDLTSDRLDFIAKYAFDGVILNALDLIHSTAEVAIARCNEYQAAKLAKDNYRELSLRLLSLIGGPDLPVREKLWLGNSEVEIHEESKIADLSDRLMQLMHEPLKFPASESEICLANQYLSKFNITVKLADQPILIKYDYQQSTPPPPAVVIEEVSEDQISFSPQGMQHFEIEEEDNTVSNRGSRLDPTCILN